MTASDFGIVKEEDGKLWMLVWRDAEGKFKPAKPEELKL